MLRSVPLSSCSQSRCRDLPLPSAPRRRTEPRTSPPPTVVQPTKPSRSQSRIFHGSLRRLANPDTCPAKTSDGGWSRARVRKLVQVHPHVGWQVDYPRSTSSRVRKVVTSTRRPMQPLAGRQTKSSTGSAVRSCRTGPPLASFPPRKEVLCQPLRLAECFTDIPLRCCLEIRPSHSAAIGLAGSSSITVSLMTQCSFRR